MTFDPVYPISLDYVIGIPSFLSFVPVDGVDSKGRSILEGRSLHNKPTASDYLSCPYQDRRYHHKKPMNLGALKYLFEHQDEIDRAMMLIASGLVPELTYRPPLLRELYIFAYTAYKAPSYWAMRHLDDSTCPFDVPPEFASLSKFAHGLLHLILQMAADSDSASDREFTPTELYEYSQDKNLLVGLKEVCAAPPKVIIRTIKSIFECLEIAKKSKPKFTKRSDFTFFKFSTLCHHAERFSLIYETMRCRAMHWRALRETESVLTQSDELRHLKLRYAVPYNRIASRAGTHPDPLNEKFIRGYLDLAWAMDERVKMLVEAQLKSAEKLSRMFASTLDPDLDEWAKFSDLTVEGFSATNSEFTNLLKLKTLSKDFKQDDLVVFFGESPV